MLNRDTTPLSTVEEPPKHRLPGPVLRRFPRYLTHVRELQRVEQKWVSSREISETLGLTTSTVRQDMSHLDLTGVSKRGYEVNRLEHVLGEVLGAGAIHRNVIVGAGLLGRALALHADFEANGFKTVALFDNAPKVIGQKVGPLVVRPMSHLKRLCRSQKVDIGVVAVPAAAAQQVAEQLVAAGVKGLLNMAHMHLHVPRHVVVVEARIVARMQEIAYAIRTRQNQQNAAGVYAPSPASEG